jgi:hypothetical protein
LFWKIKAQGTANFFAALNKIAFAFLYPMELNSKSVCPALTLIIQYSTAPFPLPIRISFGLLVTGISGKALIHSFSCFRKLREICFRVASNCFLFKRLGFNIFKPKIP